MKIPPRSIGSTTPSGAPSFMPTASKTSPPSARSISVSGFCRPKKQTNWQLDATINDRGIHLDRKLLDAALKIAAAAQRAIDAELQSITAGAVIGVNATAKMQAWLSQAGCVVDNLQKPTLQQALTRTDITPAAHRVMTLRLDGAHAAAKKLQTMRNWMADDDRVRHCFRYHGASPGRFTSLGIQVQNMKRPGVKDMAAAIEAVATGDLDHLRSRYPRPVSVIGDIARALVCAPAGRTLIIADFSGIESRATGLDIRPAIQARSVGKLRSHR